MMKEIFNKFINDLKQEIKKEVKKSLGIKQKSRKNYQSQNTKKKKNISNKMNAVDSFDEVIEVKMTHLIDGDTAWFIFPNKQKYKARFLFIDTPESTKIVEKYGKEATNFVRNEFKNADKVEVEFDQKRYDHYDRLLVWVWITKNKKRMLLQEVIAANGYVEKFYDYGSYKYEDRVRKSLNDKYNIFEQKNIDRHTKKKY